MFNTTELQALLSGTSGDIDVEDWKKYAKYDNCSESNSVPIFSFC